MTNNAKQHIFFADDEPKVRELVGKTLERLGTKVSCFASASECLEQLRSQQCDLLITDVKMPGMDGLELLVEAKRIVSWLPVLVVTGYGDVPMAVKAVKMGASDFIEKPLDRQSFLSAVESLLKPMTPIALPLCESLTKTEIGVLRLILDGKGNKEMADLLCRSVSTVKTHRKHIMRKLGVSNVVDLVKRVTGMVPAEWTR